MMPNKLIYLECVQLIWFDYVWKYYVIKCIRYDLPYFNNPNMYLHLFLGKFKDYYKNDFLRLVFRPRQILHS